MRRVVRLRSERLLRWQLIFISSPLHEPVGESIGPALDRGIEHLHGVRIVVVRQQHLLATSFHPELTGDGRVHAFFVEMVREAVS